MADHSELPAYTSADLKTRLLAAGASGTVYAMVMHESEAVIRDVVDGSGFGPYGSDEAREAGWLSRFREPWTQKQDAMHVEYFDGWTEWASPVVSFDPNGYPFRYPTAGASEGIFKLMSEFAASVLGRGGDPAIHVFEGEYEGFSAFAGSLGLPVVRHDRSEWRAAARIDGDAQFWISQPSAIDGMVWDDFDAFARGLAETSSQVELIPDLSYVGAVAREFSIDLDLPNVPAFVISQSKPFGGYYHRCGGVFARAERPSLFGNRWFKNLTSLAWGVRMMEENGVFDLPRRYRAAQEQAASDIGRRLKIDGLKAADVFVLGIAPVPSDPSDLATSLLRGSPSERIVRVCLTPTMTILIDPAMAPDMADAIGKAELQRHRTR